MTYRWDLGLAGGQPSKVSALDPRSEIVNIAMSDTVTAAVESSGQVFTWSQDGAMKHLPGLNGINIVNIAVGDKFYCLLTDRGILLTMGEGRFGCLGHGDTNNLTSPKIVEALLGDDITDISAGDKHVAVVTADGEVFTWGEAASGCLGHGDDTGAVVATPELVDTDEDIEKVSDDDNETLTDNDDVGSVWQGSHSSDCP